MRLFGDSEEIEIPLGAFRAQEFVDFAGEIRGTDAFSTARGMWSTGATSV